MRNALRFLNFGVALPFIGVVWLYQRTLSPDHGLMRVFFPFGACRHTPTCSQYAMHQLKSSFLPVAFVKILWRVASCHPGRKLSDEKMREITEKL